MRRRAAGKKQGLVKNTCVSIWRRGKFPSREKTQCEHQRSKCLRKVVSGSEAESKKEGGKVALDSPRPLSFLLCAAAY